MASTLKWHVHKFGGTSVGDATCFRRVCDIIRDMGGESIRLAIVVSAMGGKPKTTDLLIQLTTHAAADDWDNVEKVLSGIRVKHTTCIQELFGKDAETSQRLVAVIDSDLAEIVSLLRAVQVMREAHPSIVGIVSGYGEQWSTQILRDYLQTKNDEWSYMDARKVLRVEGGGTADVAVCWDESSKQLQESLQKCAGNLVITGFIASSRGGGSTTLGRDGSDFSASVFGRLLNAEQITIWTDVSGVLSADPRKVPDAYALSAVSYKEAAELAYFGAKVVHPKTMIPAMKRSDWQENAESIPIFIRNTFAPKDQGTKIFEPGPWTWERSSAACGFTAMDNMALISIEGLGMQGCPGVAARLFGALHTAGISIVLIAQASSEQSISYVVDQKDAQRAKTATEEVFAREIHVVGAIERVEVLAPCSIVAAVGDAMPGTSGVAGTFFKALGQAGVNVLGIAQGQNQRNISAVVNAADSQKAVQLLHAAFLAIVPIAIGVIGAGKVAENLLKEIGQRHDELAANMGVDLRILAVCDPVDRTMCSWQGCAERRGQVALAERGGKLDPLNVLNQMSTHQAQDEQDVVDVMLRRLSVSRTVNKVIFDCSDSKIAATRYFDIVEKGISCITQNYVGYTRAAQAPEKEPGSPLTRRLSNSFIRCEPDTSPILGGGAKVYTGAALGRGLPILSTLETLLEGGDRVTRVDGVFSLSLHLLCNKVSPVDGSSPLSFSDAKILCEKEGIFEENSEEDLKGHHARLQLSILALELALQSGSEINMPEIEVQPMTEQAVVDMLLDKPDMVLRYVGEIDALTMKGTLKLTLLPKTHPFAQLPAGSRMTRFFTERRGAESPVAVSGPVNGRLVVDALLADCLFLSKRLGAKRAMVTDAHEGNTELHRLLQTRRIQSRVINVSRPRQLQSSPVQKPAASPAAPPPIK
mmetsp:Transcript_128283/g.222408  ORF Transcript_128283/g.222408 Transcript_128283/m.222408 type:complete len:927 (-) Transcript_128283:130-2910(-)